MTLSTKAQSLAELYELEAEGVALPMPAAQIVEIESMGGMVNLVTGKVLWNGTELPVGLTPTAYGETMAYLMEVGLYDGGDYANA